jgi:hypothetical protein
LLRTVDGRRATSIVARLVGAAVAFGFCWSPGEALADDARTIALQYESSAGCPDRNGFAQELQRHTRVSIGDEAGALFIAKVVLRIEGDALGSIEWAEDGSHAIRREVRAPDCHEVVAALALILGLALDPEGLNAATPVQPPESIPRSPVPAATARPPPPAPESLRVPPPERRRSRRWRPGSGVLGGFMTGIGPGFPVTAGAYVEATYDGAGLWSPSVQLGALYARSDAQTSAGDAALTWTTLRLVLVPLRIGPGPWFLEPGATFDLGRLHGRGYDTVNPQQSTADWYGPGVMLRTGVLAWDSIALALQLAAHFPLARDSFKVLDQLAYEVPARTVSGLLMVGVRP